ncbi:unnamed protein product [Vitrella brassicaformis CCMP3155]|uniref:Haem-binding uptake Tiki superfamily ChaN domain-containing protein n=2 Tax=Vitrella brassicaformis TaxID=1169539 RepID=A0A0G4EQW0_VITBC|nr:unnamed protein product [Vitrella brassicaformis CCMP3155]|eukprot:CEL99640.1 unnamed protein product [Vitrella brassicaformis CCMP3155]
MSILVCILLASFAILVAHGWRPSFHLQHLSSTPRHSSAPRQLIDRRFAAPTADGELRDAALDLGEGGSAKAESRRGHLQYAAALAGGLLSLPALSADAASMQRPTLDLPPYSLDTSKAFEVKTRSWEQPSSLPVIVTPLSQDERTDALRRWSVRDGNTIVLMGEHHNAPEDHRLQAALIAQMEEERQKGSNGKLPPIAIGLEQVQVDFQPILDGYLSGKYTDVDLYTKTEWATRWAWPFDAYLPIFQLAKKRGLHLIALNPSTEDTSAVVSSGLEGLGQQARDKFIPDPLGFRDQTRRPGFKMYVDEVVLPSYGYHANAGLLGDNPTPANFFAARIVRDEAMAAGAVQHVRDNPGSLMVVLVGSDHVKYTYGCQDRAARLGAFYKLPDFQVWSILLNPTPIDSVSDSSQMRLALTRGPFPLPLADYLWYSNAREVVRPSELILEASRKRARL